MATITDPARELVDICSRLSAPSNRSGQDILAEAFGVQAWSTEFFQILFLISQRIDGLVEIVQELEMDQDLLDEAVQHVRAIQQAFTPSGVQNAWSHATNHYISPTHVGPVRMLVPQVRASRSYPKLDEEETAEILGSVEELLGWLKERQLHENDFVRQTIIDGLEQFHFRLSRIEWVGWGYSLQALRDVIGAYLALERGTLDLAAAPDADAVLRKVSNLVASVFEKIKVTKEFAETGDFMLKAYGAATLLIQGKQGIAGNSRATHIRRGSLELSPHSLIPSPAFSVPPSVGRCSTAFLAYQARS
jgi:hypothetical protein